jgi:hypothetical protein
MIYIGSDTLFKWDLMKDIYGNYVNDASVQGTLYDGDTALHVFDFDYVVASDGQYIGVVPASVTENLEQCKDYTVEITATRGDEKEVRVDTHTAEYRGHI